MMDLLDIVDRDGEFTLDYINVIGRTSNLRWTAKSNDVATLMIKNPIPVQSTYFHSMLKFVNKYNQSGSTGVRYVHRYDYGTMIDVNNCDLEQWFYHADKLPSPPKDVIFLNRHDNGKHPSFVKVEIIPSVKLVSVVMEWRNRVGPKEIRFHRSDAFDFINRIVLMKKHLESWTPEMDQKYNYYGLDFFKNEIDKIEYLANQRDFRLE